MIEGSITFTGNEEEQKQSAIMMIIGLMEQHDINTEDLEFY